MVYLLFILPGLLFSMWASSRVQQAYSRYSQIGTMSGMNGVQAARHILDRAGLFDVRIVRTPGRLSDHYNPLTRELALSEGVYDSRSVAAVAIAAHEAGHALQHAANYLPLWIRSALVPTANFGSSIGYLVMGVGALMAIPKLIIVGLILVSGVLLFQLATLPVEFDASARAKEILAVSGIVHPSEREGVDRVLNAAAMTYVAAVTGVIGTMLYYMYRAGLFGQQSREY